MHGSWEIEVGSGPGVTMAAIQHRPILQRMRLLSPLLAAWLSRARATSAYLAGSGAPWLGFEIARRRRMGPVDIFPAHQ